MSEPLPAPTCAGWWWRRYTMSYYDAPWSVVRIVDWNGDLCETDADMNDILPLDKRCEWIGPITPPDP